MPIYPLMDWRQHYRENLVTPDEAVSTIASGDGVTVSVNPHPNLLLDALAARRDELRGVKLHLLGPHYDPGWLQPGWEDSFPITIMFYLGDVARPAHDQRYVDFQPMLLSTAMKPFDEEARQAQDVDYLLIVVSPPDDHGFCSFGAELWDKRRVAKYASHVIAVVDENQVRTYGSNYIHVSEIDRFVEHTPPALPIEAGQKLLDSLPDGELRSELERISPLMSDVQRQEAIPTLMRANVSQVRGWARWAGWVPPPEPILKIAEYVHGLVHDGDSVQIGVGTPGVYLPGLGVFDDKKDLGWHAEMSAPGILSLVKRGIVNGSRKTIHQGKAVFSGLMGSTPAEVEFAKENPLVELWDADHILDIQNIASNPNHVAINNAISIDLTGQINSETLFGGRLYNGTGGQPELHIGAVLSEGGRAITLLTSTALGGAVSKIVAQHEEGAAITIPRTFADYVITEYGVARLLGKSVRERARALISIAHPDFRPELERAAKQLYYP